MSSRRWLRSLTILLTAAACAAPAKSAEAPPIDPAALKDAIQAREKEWSAAFLAGNGAAIAALYTEDAQSIQPVGDSWSGRAAIAKGEQAQLDTLAVTAREDIAEEVIPAGADHAIEVGHYSYQATSKTTKKPVSSSGRYMVLWRKDADGAWRLQRDIGTEAPAKAPMMGALPAKKG
jgi:uncharacterized protein (TIGR02246 family)